MGTPEPYDLLAILAGDKPRRHPPAVELMRRGWARYVTVTGEQERIEATPGLVGQILTAPPSTSTYEDALSIRVLVEQHRFSTVLVVTSASQCDRARLVLGRVLRDVAASVDVLAWEQALPGDRPAQAPLLPVLRHQFRELCKLVYYRTLRRL